MTMTIGALRAWQNQKKNNSSKCRIRLLTNFFVRIARTNQGHQSIEGRIIRELDSRATLYFLLSRER